MTVSNCQYHCRGWPHHGCNGHFSSLHAFDMHRQGPYDGDRVCLDPADVDGLEPHPVMGRCDHARPRHDRSVTIWRVVMSDKQRKGLERLERRRQPSEHRPGSAVTGAGQDG